MSRLSLFDLWPSFRHTPIAECRCCWLPNKTSKWLWCFSCWFGAPLANSLAVLIGNPKALRSAVGLIAPTPVASVSFWRHSLCALHLSWWFRISRRKFELPSTKDVRISGISLHHFRQNVQNMTPVTASYFNQSNSSSQFGRNRPPLRWVEDELGGGVIINMFIGDDVPGACGSWSTCIASALVSKLDCRPGEGALFLPPVPSSERRFLCNISCCCCWLWNSSWLWFPCWLLLIFCCKCFRWWADM